MWLGTAGAASTLSQRRSKDTVCFNETSSQYAYKVRVAVSVTSSPFETFSAHCPSGLEYHPRNSYLSASETVLVGVGNPSYFPPGYVNSIVVGLTSPPCASKVTVWVDSSSYIAWTTISPGSVCVSSSLRYRIPLA